MLRAEWVAAIWLTAALATLPAHAGDDCPGSGFGGTGLRPEAGDGSGFGGTGHRDCGARNVGIAGVITGFGSIWVNGLEVFYDAKTPRETPFNGPATGPLRIGQTVAVEALDDGRKLQARHIVTTPALAGKARRLDRNVLKVLNQRVLITPHTRIIGWKGKPPRSGSRITVYGFRRGDGLLLATRIERAARTVPDLIQGEVSALSPDGSFELHGMRCRVEDAALHGRLRNGAAVVVAGEALPEGYLRVGEVVPAPLAALLTRVDALVLEGYAQRLGSLPGQRNGLLIHGLRVTESATTLHIGTELGADGYARVSVQPAGGELHLRTLDPAPASRWPDLLTESAPPLSTPPDPAMATPATAHPVGALSAPNAASQILSPDLLGPLPLPPLPGLPDLPPAMLPLPPSMPSLPPFHN